MTLPPPPADAHASTLPPSADGAEDVTLTLARLRMTADNALYLLRSAYAEIAALRGENERLRARVLR